MYMSVYQLNMGQMTWTTCVLSAKRALVMLESSAHVIFHLRASYNQVAETASPE
jgi:hypothetical protein